MACAVCRESLLDKKHFCQNKKRRTDADVNALGRNHTWIYGGTVDTAHQNGARHTLVPDGTVNALRSSAANTHRHQHSWETCGCRGHHRKLKGTPQTHVPDDTKKCAPQLRRSSAYTHRHHCSGKNAAAFVTAAAESPRPFLHTPPRPTCGRSAPSRRRAGTLS